MNRTPRWHGILVVLFTLVLAAPMLAEKTLTGIPLVWKPTDTKSAGIVNLTTIANVKVQVDALVDTRTSLGKFGESQEGKTPKPVTTSDNVAEFCTQHVRELLRQSGFSVVTGGGDVALSGEILDFMVTETNTYKGEVRLKLTLSRGGKAQWTGISAGDSSRFGRSFKAENYYETISDSLLHAIQNLTKDNGFLAALTAASK